MAYDRKKIFEQAKEMIVKHKLFFVEDIVAFLPIVKKTFYEYFPIDSNESNDLKVLLEKNKIDIKIGLRKKWYDSSNATSEAMLYKLVGTKEERMRLSTTYQEILTDEKPINERPKIEFE